MILRQQGWRPLQTHPPPRLSSSGRRLVTASHRLGLPWLKDVRRCRDGGPKWQHAWCIASNVPLSLPRARASACFADRRIDDDPAASIVGRVVVVTMCSTEGVGGVEWQLLYTSQVRRCARHDKSPVNRKQGPALGTNDPALMVLM